MSGGRRRRAGACAAALAAVALALAGCTGGGERSHIARVGGLIKDRLSGGGEELDIGRTVEPTRQQLDQIPYAMIAFSYRDLPRVFMIPLADNNGYLTYQDENRRGLAMYGGAVAGTLGLGNDLLSVRHAPNDPVAHQTPLAQWPRAVARSYRYRVRDLDDYLIVPACEFRIVERQPIKIVELVFDTTRVEETCTNARRQFTNEYWVDPQGFIWASRQWLGPELEQAYIEIVRPYGG